MKAGLVPAALWTVLAEAPHRLIALDFDGTLAPYAKDPRDAHAIPASLASPARLAAGVDTTIAIVSGRPIPNLSRVVPLERLHLVGEHGWEERPPGGEVLHHPLTPEAEAGLARVLDAMVREGTAAKLERKRTGIAIHTRALGEEDRARALDHFRAVCERTAGGSALRLDLLDGGAEIHAVGRDKGTAMRSLLAPLPPRTVPIYAGDDVTDEAAFEAVRDRGWGFKVGGTPGSTAARHHLAGPVAVAEFLDQILRVLEGEAARGAGARP